MTFQAVFGYFMTFAAVYVQVFLLVTFLEKRRTIFKKEESATDDECLSVTVIVPCYNEESTVSGTIQSLLDLDYPRHKLKIFAVDDGSTDRTWDVLQGFRDNSLVRLFKKENGGKHTAVNLGLANIETELVGTLDADSFADRAALRKIVKYFENEKIMAVVPSIIIHQPRNLVELAQKVEYQLSIFIKKMLGLLGAMHVTPGPLSVFRKKVFDDLGYYRKAYNTEDAELALRMQKNRYKIEYCLSAHIYTKAPNTVKKLYKQRLRWTYGFLRNSLDYKELFFDKKYGHLSFFTLPAGIFALLSVLFIAFFAFKNFSVYVADKFLEVKTIGSTAVFSGFHFDWFYVNTESFVFILLIVYLLALVSMLLGRKMSEGRTGLSVGMVYFVILSGFVAPLWILKSIYNFVVSRETVWR